jgi:selenocysteine lyase/cysteine desulfurase
MLKLLKDFPAPPEAFTTLPGVNPAWIRAQLIGQDATAQTPFGERRIVYADYVASGRSLQWIETFILKQVLPLYANTHTEDSATGACMTTLAHDAASYIKRCLGAQNGKLLAPLRRLSVCRKFSGSLCPRHSASG